MEPFRRLSAPALALPLANVDTDQLIPARFMKAPRSAGYGGFLLHDLRVDADGAPVPGFPLNHPQATEARTLVARRNFGAGSSREAAVYALVDFGFRCVVAPSFGDIFAANAVNNGLLPATVPEADLEAILALMGEAPTTMDVDLESGTLAVSGRTFPFSVPETWRAKLLNGWDDIGLAQQHAAAIAAFARDRQRAHPWVIPAMSGPAAVPPQAQIPRPSPTQS
ncbi:3-isopropylmalate dehydratase small subunit [Roseospira goensis]|uniref:3-isopropylmalate dehydratase n=1 Tax=Roseospira goensis TaxID=391922 RepID=A0A7W6S300_9PROT|nr:3-isopropylmalate dehydratase small subunit [Roseospira goensis]MBB4287899.1 3-isopropylmalate/(R)-2-methylmalate dehydratase small subunit [Roseospira goensis]